MHEVGGPETHAEPPLRDPTGPSVAAAWELLLTLARRAQCGDPLVARTVFALQRDGLYEPLPSASASAGETYAGLLRARAEAACAASSMSDASSTSDTFCIDPEGSSVLAVPADPFLRTAQPRARTEAHELLELMLPLVVGRRARSLVVGHLGQSLDGRVATPTGASKFITGREDIVHTHRLRALFDAVIVGVRTVQLDDPQLTTRLVSGPHPTRVVLDPQGKLSAGFKVLDDGASPTLICTSLARTPVPRRVGQVWWLGLPCPAGRFALGPLQKLLAARGLSRLFVEGGGVTVSGFLAARALDRLHVSVAPLILGSGAPAFKLPEIDQLDEALSLRCRHFSLGRDVLFDCQLTPALPDMEAE